MTVDLDKLEALARAATPGPWALENEDAGEDVAPFFFVHKPGPDGAPDDGMRIRVEKHHMHPARKPVIGGPAWNDLADCALLNAEYIAATNPATILALIAIARRAAPDAPAAQAIVGHAELNRFMDGYCNGKPELMACAQAAMFFFNACARAAHPIGQVSPAIGQPAHADGWKMIPLVCTPEMRAAWDHSPSSEDDDVDFHNAYRAMIDAAPAPVCHAPADLPLGSQRWSKEAEMMESWAAHADAKATQTAPNEPQSAHAQQGAATGKAIPVCGCGHDMSICVVTSCDKGIELVDETGKADAASAGRLTDAQLDRIARNYFAEEYAQQHVKNAIHDAFLEAGQPTATSAADAMDAARYRWIRARENNLDAVVDGDTMLFGECLDHAIDTELAAMAASRNGGAS